MLSQAQRITILELNAQQVSKREIARVLGIPRGGTQSLRSNSTPCRNCTERRKRTPPATDPGAFREVPEESRAVYRLQQRLVDIEGYVALNSNRYSVPVDWIGRRVEVRETRDKIEIQLDAAAGHGTVASPKPSTSE